MKLLSRKQKIEFVAKLENLGFQQIGKWRAGSPIWNNELAKTGRGWIYV
jgi:hypothetical protein